MATLDPKKTLLHVKSGSDFQPIYPETIAEQVIVNDKDGNASTLDLQVTQLRTEITNQKVTVDSALSDTSENPVQNKVVKAAIDAKAAKATTLAGYGITDAYTKNETDSAISTAISKAGHASYKVVSAVPEASAAEANIMYLVMNATTGYYDVYCLIDGAVVRIDDTSVDLSNYVQKETGKGLSTNDFTDALKTKLDGIEAGADVTDATNVAAAGAFMKASDTADSISDGTTKVVMTQTERTKLTGIAEGAEVNQNAFAKVSAGGTTMTASAKQDTISFAAGSGITITGSGKTVTVAESYIDSCVVSALSDVPSNLRDGGLAVVLED